MAQCPTDSALGVHCDSEGRVGRTTESLSLCIDSLLVIPPEAFAGGTVTIDEAEQAECTCSFPKPAKKYALSSLEDCIESSPTREKSFSWVLT